MIFLSVFINLKEKSQNPLTVVCVMRYNKRKKEKSMPIHHDKAVYGRLAKTREDISDDELIALAQELSLADGDCLSDNGKKTKKEVENEK